MSAATASPFPRSCTTCHKLESDLKDNLKYCAKCRNTLYCSRECQKADWKQHKQVCGGKQTGKQSPISGRHNPDFEVANLLLGRAAESSLHNIPEKDVFAQLIDCFRRRCEHHCSFV